MIIVSISRQSSLAPVSADPRMTDIVDGADGTFRHEMLARRVELVVVLVGPVVDESRLEPGNCRSLDPQVRVAPFRLGRVRRRPTRRRFRRHR